MAAMLTGTRAAGFCTVQRTSTASHAVVRPFTARRPAHGARIPTVRAASQEARTISADDEDDDFEEILAGMLLQEDETMVGDDGVTVELSEEQQAAEDAISQIDSTAGMEAMAEAFMATQLSNGNAAEEAQLRKRGALLFAQAAAGRGGSAAQQDALLAAVAAQVAEGASMAEDVEDFQGSPNGFSPYDEDEEAAMTAEQKAAISQFKLSKAELKGLLPSTWDSANVDFFSNKRDLAIALPEFKLNVLWMDKNIAVAVDQVYSRGQTSPLTEYFFWPRKDAWEELKIALEARPWILERDKVALLNRLTQIINFWQDDQSKPTVAEATVTFPDCSFSSA